MNKCIFSCAIAAAVVFTASAQAEDLTGFFVNGDVGHVDYRANINNHFAGTAGDTAELINIGYRTQFIGFEAGYTNLGSISGNDQAGDSYKLSGKGFTIGMNGHFNPTEQWYISTRVGGFRWRLDARVTTGGNSLSGYDQGLGWYAGAGTGYDFNRHWSVGVAYNYYSINKNYAGIGKMDIGSNMFTVDAEYRF